MQIDRAIADLQQRIRNPRATNLVYLRFPVIYTPSDPALRAAKALGVDLISVLGLLVHRFGDHWGKLVAAKPDQLDTVSMTLAQELVAAVKDRPCAVVGDTDVLYAFPSLNPTALLYPLSGDRVIVISVKANHVAAGLRLLEDGPVYPVDNCTVLEIDQGAG